jgi:hypothetical protein
MKYMLLSHAESEGWSGLASWSPEDFKRMFDYMLTLDGDLRESGELLDDNGLAGPGSARTVRAQADGRPIVRDGLRDGATDFLAGYWVVEVASAERAVEIATQISVMPGPGGKPINTQVEIHEIGEPRGV